MTDSTAGTARTEVQIRTTVPTGTHARLRWEALQRGIPLGDHVANVLTAHVGDPSGALDREGLRPATPPTPSPPAGHSNDDAGYSHSDPPTGTDADLADPTRHDYIDSVLGGCALCHRPAAAHPTHPSYDPAIGLADPIVESVEVLAPGETECDHDNVRNITGGLKRCSDCGKVRGPDRIWRAPA